MASKGYEPEWRKKIRRAAQRAAAWLRVERKRLEGLPVEERKRLEELRVEWEAAKSKGFPLEERKRLEELRVEWEAAKRAARKLRAERFAQSRTAVDAFHREKKFKKRLKKLGTPVRSGGQALSAWRKAISGYATADLVTRKQLSARGKVIAIEYKWPGKVVDALAEALARRILTTQSKRRKVMSTEEITEVSLPPILCGIPQAAAMIGRGTRFIYEAIATGQIAAVKSDRRTLVIVRSLHEYVKTLDKAKIRPMARRARRRRVALGDQPMR